jgi:hypothetical protein
MARPVTKRTPDYYFELAEDAAANHNWSTAVHYTAKGLALFPDRGMKAPQMRLAAEYRQKRDEWMQDAAKASEALLKHELANDPEPDSAVKIAFPEAFKIWKCMSAAERMDVLNRSATPAGQYRRLAVCMVTIRDDLKAAAERARLIEEGRNVRRKPSQKTPRVPSEKEVFKALDSRKAATKRRMGAA